METVFIFFAILFVTLSLTRCIKQMGRNLPPGPLGLPIIGNLPILFENDSIWHILKRLSDSYGSVYTLYLGIKPTVVLCDHLAIRDAFIRHGDQFSGRPYVYSISLLTRNYCGVTFGDFSPKWTRQRKSVSIALHSHTISRNGATSAEEKIMVEADQLLKILAEKQHRSVDVTQDVCLAVMNFICNITFNQRYKVEDDEFQMILRDNRQSIEFLAPGDPVDAIPLLRVFPNKRLRLIEELVARRDALLEKKLKEHLQTFDPSNIRDITDALVKAMRDSDDDCQDISEDLVIMTMWEVFTGGFQTISETMKWAIAYLVNYQEVQDKIRDDMAYAIGDRLPRWSDKAALPYLYATVLEILRCSSISSLNAPHRTIEDTTFRGYFIPKDTMIMCNLWWVHHDPKYWKEPSKFDPARFLNDEGNVVIPPSFLPFSAGRRACIGEKIAKMELFLFLGCMIQRFHFGDAPGEPYPDLEPIPSNMFRLVKPYKVYITPR